MDELFTVWYKLVGTDALMAALDSGKPAVVHLIGDEADALAQDLIPAYAAAVLACQTAGALVDCDAKRIQLRDSALLALLDAVGVGALVDDAIRLWHALPKAVRATVASAVRLGSSAISLLKHPSIANLKKTIAAAASLAKNVVVPILKDVVKGVLKAPAALVKWVKSFGNAAASVVKGLLKAAGYEGQAVEAAVSHVAGRASQFLGALSSGDVGGALAAGAGAVEDTISDVGSVLTFGLL